MGKRISRVVAVLFCLHGTLSSGAEEVRKIQDNSFLIEEAYNQEHGVVQQIVPRLSFPIGVGPSEGDFGVFCYLSFEHPLF